MYNDHRMRFAVGIASALALLAPALQLAGDASPVTAIARATRRALRAVDAQLEPRVPPSLLASVKFCARKAA